MKRKDYEKPTMRIFELRYRTMLLVGSGTRSSGTPTYSPFNDEQKW